MFTSMTLRYLVVSVLVWLSSALTTDGALASEQDVGPAKIIIAHRGASGYVPEHTIAAKAMAYAMGADYIEQDLVMTKDDALSVLHDHHLEDVTNVHEVYPNRARRDGRYYVVDFTLDEIRLLAVHERTHESDGKRTRVYKDRFPLGKSRFRIHTFEEEIELIQGLNQTMGRDIGIYPEIKSPAFHRKEGKDIARAVLRTLAAYGYTNNSDKVHLQCFDRDELKRIREELLQEAGMDLKLVQLLKASDDYAWALTKNGMEKVAEYASGIGPSMGMLVRWDAKKGLLKSSGLVKRAHAAGLVVHPYTFRKESNTIPEYAKNFNDLLDIFMNGLGVDGVFTDFPDKAIVFRHAEKK